MRNWILRQGAPSIDAHPDRKKVIIRSKRRVSISPGERLVFLNQEWIFTCQSRVISIARGGAETNSQDQTDAWELVVEGWTKLAEPVEFDLFTASLTFVRNWNQPRLHLRPSYRLLSDEDLETIQAGEPFVAREVYLSLLQALPETMRQKYKAQHSAGWMERYFPSRFFADRAASIIEFIEQRVISVGSTLIEINDRWKEVLRESLAPGALEAYFSSDDDTVFPDSISHQATAFETLLATLRTEGKSEEEGLLFSAITQALSLQTPVERRFEFIFRSRVDEQT